MLTRTRLVVVALVLAALTSAAAAGAKIELQRGIAGVRLFMSQQKVRALLGRPVAVKSARNEFGSYTEFRYRGLRILFQGNGGVTYVSTTRRSERTRSGLGVGSSERQLRRGLRGIRCEREAGFHHCYVGSLRPGRRVTDFVLRTSRVVRVSVGIVID